MSDKVVTMKKGPRSGLVLWLVIFVAILLGLLYMIVGQSTIRQVIVTGSVHYSNDEIKAMVGIEDDTTVLEVFMHRNQAYDHLPYIKNVVINYLSFNSLQIDVTEKEVISYIPYQGTYLALDKDGNIVGYESEKVMALPSVEGLYFEKANIGEALDVSSEVLATMLDLYHLGNKYELIGSEIDFVQGDADMVHLYVDDIRIVIGEPVDLDRKMKAASEVLMYLDRDAKGSLDLQLESEQYIFKEDVGDYSYISYGERYLAVDEAFVVQKIGVHRMKGQLLIKGLGLEQATELQVAPISMEIIEAIQAIRVAAKEAAISLEEIDFAQGDLSSIYLGSGSVTLRLSGLEGIQSRLIGASLIMVALENDARGTIDLRGDAESYAFVAEKDE